MSIRSIILVFFLFLSVVCPLAAQHRDTVYVERETVTYDTVTVYDTVRVHDTLNIADYLRSEEFERLFYSSEYVDNLSLTDSLKEKLLQQTVTFWENRVFKDEQQTFSSMDSIKKYGLAGLIILGLNAMSPAQTDSTTAEKTYVFPEKKKTHLYENPINGFHLGYTIQYDIIESMRYISTLTREKSHEKPRSGFHAGVEFAYHFADYFGVSAGLEFGIVGVGNKKLYDYFPTIANAYGFSLPLKFEFHYPIGDRVLLATHIGTRLYAPFITFLEGFSGFSQNNNPNPIYGDPQFCLNKTLHADLLVDLGIYYRLPNNDYLRFLAGINYAPQKYLIGISKGSDEYYSAHNADYVSKGNGDEVLFSSHNNHIYFQLAYMHGFSKKRKIIQAQPHWSTEVGMHNRHEIRFEISDPLGIHFLTIRNESSIWEDFMSDSPPPPAIATAFRSTPVFSLNYHYRLTKWFWIGAMMNYAYYKDHTDYTNQLYNDRWMHCITLMPELRFSYLNRPHVTLYSAMAVGTTLFADHENPSWKEYDGQWWKLFIYPTFQLTAFGIRAGGDHLFGTFEAGCGIKGIVSAGIGYTF